MRVKRLTTMFVLGLAVALAYATRRRRGAPPRRAVPTGTGVTPAEIDPTTLGRPDETAELFVEAISEWSLDADAFASDDVSPGENARPDVYDDPRAARGSGDLYGVHVPPAVEHHLPDDDHAQAEGENWLEHLEARSAELGPEPEHVLDMSDDSDSHAGHHKTATSDTPVADHGSGGPRGL